MSSALKEMEKLLGTMSRSEKAQVLQRVARDLCEAYPGVESQARVSGGAPCLVRTRIPVWLLEQARRLGTSEADLLFSYPALDAEDLTNAWAYTGSHRTEIEANESED